MSYKKTVEQFSSHQFKILFWTVFGASRGCYNRARIIQKLKETPLNANQLAEKLDLDYKVVCRHLIILNKHDLVIKVGYGYGKVYFLSPLIKSNLDIFNQMILKSKNCKEN